MFVAIYSFQKANYKNQTVSHSHGFMTNIHNVMFFPDNIDQFNNSFSG
jgi:hypothetical protein